MAVASGFDAVALDLGVTAPSFLSGCLGTGTTPSKANGLALVPSHGDRTHALRTAAEAYDSCEKPVDISLLGTVAARRLRLRTLADENRRLPETPSSSPIKHVGPSR